jgi:hypothetical protein
VYQPQIRYPTSTHHEATNLANWHRYEMQFPETFRNMYYLWLAHKADHETKDTAPAIWATSFL